MRVVRRVLIALLATAIVVTGVPAAAKTIRGTPKGETIRGTKKADRLYGRGGHDRITGLAGRDRLYGGDGDDKLHGSAGKDRLYAGNGNDRLYGDSDRDLLNAGPGDDMVYGGAGDDVLHGGAGSDQFNTNEGFPTGGDGNDTIYARDGEEDVINCGPGVDTAVLDAVEDGVFDCENIQEPEGTKPEEGRGG